MKNSTQWDRSQRACAQCSSAFLPVRKWQKTCSYKCGYTLQNKKVSKKQTNSKLCARCTKPLISKKINAIYCSRTCKSMEHTFKNRPKTRPVTMARRAEIFIRDEGNCYMCESKVDSGKFELDHLIPVSRGGSSDVWNLAVSCPPCNRSRGNRIEIRQLVKLSELRP